MTNQSLTGLDFNQKYEKYRFVKLTNYLENHNGFQFQTGLNIDSVGWNDSGECEGGGIYFCEVGKLSRWLNYSRNSMIYYRLVTIPYDALVWVERDKFKANRIILGERHQISDLEEWNDLSYCMEAVRQNVCALEYVSEIAKFYLEVGENGAALQYVKNEVGLEY